ncbi:MAG: CotH kinase family protein [Flavobacteriales bacterium]|nr:CotH kinase family protein [Flavobacteriales bacterium]
MKKGFLILFVFCYCFSFGQTLYNPQDLYDTPGGLFEEDSIRSIHLNFYNSNYHPDLVVAWYYAPDERMPATLTMNGAVYDSVGVRYKGNSTFCIPNNTLNPKVPYNIDMNYYISGQKLLDYKKIKLANAWLDPTFVKQIVGSNIYRKYLPTGESNLMKLYVQSNYLGLYVNDEALNKQFLKKHFNEKSGPLFKCDNINRFCDTAGAPSAMPSNLYYMGDDSTLYYNSYDIKSDNGWKELVNLIKVIDLDFANVDSVLNVDRTLWAFAVNQTILNLDCYNTYFAHNYYLYQTKDGLFQMIPWDLDNSFVGALMGSDYWSPSNVYEYDPYFTAAPLGGSQPALERPLLYKLLNHPFYRKLYTAHIRTIMSESLDTAVIRAEITNLQSLGYNAANTDQNKGFTMQNYSYNVESAIWASFGWGIGGIISSIDERKTFLQNHPEISFIPPTITNVTVNNNLVTAEVFNGNTVKLMATESEYNSKFQSFTMLDDGQNGDAVSGDGLFTTAFPFQGSGNDVKFYIRSENNDALMLNPQSAEYEFYVYSAVSGITDIKPNNNRKLIKITDVLGRTTKVKKGVPLFYIYDDGTVEKKLILE